jgi:hypothetical protein
VTFELIMNALLETNMLHAQSLPAGDALALTPGMPARREVETLPNDTAAP